MAGAGKAFDGGENPVGRVLEAAEVVGQHCLDTARHITAASRQALAEFTDVDAAGIRSLGSSTLFRQSDKDRSCCDEKYEYDLSDSMKD